MTILEEILDDYLFGSASTVERGTKFERLVRQFLVTDVQYGAIFDAVWMWNEWPERTGHDVGIDLVARERDTGNLVAVQCKFYDPAHTLTKPDIDSFLAASGKHPFAGRLVVATTDKWNKNAEEAIHNQQIPVQRIGLTDLLDSSIDWSAFDTTATGSPELVVKAKRELRSYQSTALAKVRAGLATGDRGKLIMACGTGKTFTSLQIALDLVAPGGSVLFLVPSIALLSQSLKEWSIEAGDALRTFAVCSDAKVGKSTEDISTVDLPIPATTDPARLASGMLSDTVHRDAARRVSVVFATYQSIDVVARAQAAGVGAFDLVICDEAHRTTGATLAGVDESAFVRVHDPAYLRAAKRLYMTATPRIYDDNSKAKAGQANAVLASMDDEAVFGPELYRMGFGEAVSLGILADYRVLVLAVDEGHVNRTMQAALTDPDNSELQLDDVAKIIGCWNGLAKRGEAEHDFAGDPAPMRRAVAFSRSIRDSKRFTDRFESIVAEYLAVLDADDDAPADAGRATSDAVLPVAVRHVDGLDNMVARNGMLSWLKDDTGESSGGGQARILSNAKCLSEGVDVPALDAVLFLNPRKSQVDVVQSVGRVMRKSPGKKYGYIILPVVIPAGMRPEDALRDNERYAVVWEVLQALRAHDERFNAMVNKIELNQSRDPRINIIGVGGGHDDADDGSGGERIDAGVQGVFDLSALGDFRAAMYAKVVAKVGSRRYWEDWAKDVAVIAERHRVRLVGLLEEGHAAAEFEEFLTALRANLNESISPDDAINMLSQHLITAPIFSALFADYDFVAHNPVSRVMDRMLRALEGANLDAETASLDAFYASVRTRVEGIDNAAAKQNVIKDLYERFITLAFPRVADQLGIVYTPVEIVDFIIRSVDHLLRQEFDASLSTQGVHVLDPFTGTGTFIVRLLQSGLIDPHDLARKYADELHANEIMLLAYYIAAINIESAFHDQLAASLDAGVPYVPFDGIVLTDTFQMHEAGDLDDGSVFTANSERVTRQRKLDIRVILGNPPYSVGQTSGNDNAANLKYPSLDAAIEKTYAARSSATNKNSLYDSYIRAIRWASDRIGDEGIIGIVTNGGFLDANTADGLRLSLVDEFASIYVLNLRGNQRTAGELSRQEGGKIFGSGSRNTVAVTFLVKKVGHTGRAVVRYHDIGDYLSRERKLELVTGADLSTMDWTEITPNDAGDWLNQRSEEFGQYQAIGAKEGGTVFGTYSPGLQTNRDAWVYNSSAIVVRESVERMVEVYNGQVAEWDAYLRRHEGTSTAVMPLKDFVETDPTKISWSSSLLAKLGRRQSIAVRPEGFATGSYRPFHKQVVYFDGDLNHRVGKLPSMFPTPRHENYGFQVVAPGSDKPFSVLAVGQLPDLSVWGSGPSQFFARWTYLPLDTDPEPGAEAAAPTLDLFGEAPEAEQPGVVIDGYRRIDNITDATLATYRDWYPGVLPADETAAKDQIFAFVYGLLHAPDYRERFGADLKRSLPRIPRLAAEGFAVFAAAGTRLLDLHLHYEDADPYPLTLTGEVPSGPGAGDLYEWFAVEKLRWAGSGKNADHSTLLYNRRITVAGIPEEAHRYLLGSRSALGWIVDRYQVKTDKASGIVNDPNDWSREVGNPRYILDLIAKVTTVSVETVRIVDSLPPLQIVNP